MGRKAIYHIQHTVLSSAILAGNGLSSLATVVVAVAGKTYAVGDVITVAGGTAVFAAKLVVLEVYHDGTNAGAVKRLGFQNGDRGRGLYSAKPSSPAATTVSPAGGTGLTLTLTWNDNVPPPDATHCDVQAETQDVRFRGDGTAPSSTVGHLLKAAAAGVPTLTLRGGEMMTTKFIETTTSAKLDVTFYK